MFVCLCDGHVYESRSASHSPPSFAPPRRAPLQSRACPPQLYGVGKCIHIRNNPRDEDSKSLDLEINRLQQHQKGYWTGSANALRGRKGWTITIRCPTCGEVIKGHAGNDAALMQHQNTSAACPCAGLPE